MQRKRPYPDQQFFNIEEACTYLGVSRPTVKTLIDNKDLPAFRVGRQYRIAVSDIKAWVQRQKEKVA